MTTCGGRRRRTRPVGRRLRRRGRRRRDVLVTAEVRRRAERALPSKSVADSPSVKPPGSIAGEPAFRRKLLLAEFANTPPASIVLQRAGVGVGDRVRRRGAAMRRRRRSSSRAVLDDRVRDVGRDVPGRATEQRGRPCSRPGRGRSSSRRRATWRRVSATSPGRRAEAVRRWPVWTDRPATPPLTIVDSTVSDFASVDVSADVTRTAEVSCRR